MNIEAMLKYQGQWAEEYEQQKRIRKLEKGRREKERVKERKQQQQQIKS